MPCLRDSCVKIRQETVTGVGDCHSERPEGDGESILKNENDIPNMAESFVSLTSLVRRMSPMEETVGGPVDVVFISKGDGLIWMKRKHYFNPDLNAHFFANYYNDIEDDE